MNKENINQIKIDSLLVDLVKTDTRNKIRMMLFQILFIVLSFIYVKQVLFSNDPTITFNLRIAGALYVLAFLISLIQIRMQKSKYNQINYYDSVKKVLEDAEKRYRFWQNNTFLYVFVLLLADAASLIFLYEQFADRWPLWQFFVVSQAIIILTMSIGFSIKYVRWILVNKPVWLLVKKILKELEE